MTCTPNSPHLLIFKFFKNGQSTVTAIPVWKSAECQQLPTSFLQRRQTSVECFGAASRPTKSSEYFRGKNVERRQTPVNVN